MNCVIAQYLFYTYIYCISISPNRFGATNAIFVEKCYANGMIVLHSEFHFEVANVTIHKILATTLFETMVTFLRIQKARITFPSEGSTAYSITKSKLRS